MHLLIDLLSFPFLSEFYIMHGKGSGAQMLSKMCQLFHYTHVNIFMPDYYVLFIVCTLLARGSSCIKTGRKIHYGHMLTNQYIRDALTLGLAYCFISLF